MECWLKQDKKAIEVLDEVDLYEEKRGKFNCLPHKTDYKKQF